MKKRIGMINQDWQKEDLYNCLRDFSEANWMIFSHPRSVGIKDFSVVSTPWSDLQLPRH